MTQTLDLTSLARFNPSRHQVQLLQDADPLRVALICLEAGQEVARHTTTSHVLLYVVEGKGRITVGDAVSEVGPGQLVLCPPEIPHSIVGEERMLVLAAIAPRP